MNTYSHLAGIPIAATDIAHGFDTLWTFVVWLSVFFFILVVGAMLVFVVRHRSGSGSKPKYITGNVPIEIVWTVIPTVLLMGIFVWGYYIYSHMVQPPSNAMEIRVTGKQWLWQFQYPETGQQLTGELFVPVDQPVKLVMSSEDVLHSFFVPNFRIKQDVVPGMFTSIWFQATIPGRHVVFCTEYCGASHSRMMAHINVLTPEQWSIFQRGGKIQDIPLVGNGIPMAKAEPTGSDQVKTSSASPTHAGPVFKGMAAQGQVLVQTKGCVACHTSDGAKGVGPTFHGLYGSKVELSDGSSITADDNYIKESIEKPNARLTKGFSAVMPTFQGQLTVPEENAVIAYIRALKN